MTKKVSTMSNNKASMPWARGHRICVSRFKLKKTSAAQIKFCQRNTRNTNSGSEWNACSTCMPLQRQKRLRRRQGRRRNPRPDRNGALESNLYRLSPDAFASVGRQLNLQHFPMHHRHRLPKSRCRWRCRFRSRNKS